MGFSAFRFKNRIIARIITRFPKLSQKLVDAYVPWATEGIPWAPVKKPIKESVVALVTTSGVHLRDQEPFDMTDSNGDPSFREIGRDTLHSRLMITHDYYDHADADRDINVVFPVDRLKELVSDGIIGGVCLNLYSFMGHITGSHLAELIRRTAPSVAASLLKGGADCVVLTPG
jgi:D-proline reductase (dithiol) PrdB